MLLEGAKSTPESGPESKTEKDALPTTTVVQKVCYLFQRHWELHKRLLQCGNDFCDCDKDKFEREQDAVFLCCWTDRPFFHDTHTHKLPSDQDVIEPRL